MKMDIATPAEMLRFEQADFGDERRQAYLTFQNESAFPITAVSGLLAMTDSKGQPVETRRVSFGDLHAPAGEPFTCHLALDEYPLFAEATMIVEDVLFDGEEPWALHPTRLRDYTPDILPDGPERVALVDIAGPDAVCYPFQQDSQWVCVCGRFNRWRWTTCRRCKRERNKVLSLYTPERIQAAHSAQRERAQQKPPRMIVEPDAHEKRKAARAKVRPPEPEKEGIAAILTPSHILTALACIAVVAAVIWGVMSLTRRIPVAPTGNAPQVVDYLTPVGVINNTGSHLA